MEMTIEQQFSVVICSGSYSRTLREKFECGV